MSDILDFYSTNSLSWEQLEFTDGELKNLHYGMIHVGLPTLLNLRESKLPTIKDGNEPKSYTLCINGDVAFADASEDTNDVAKAIELVETDGQKVVFGLHTIHGRDNKGLTEAGFKGYLFSSRVFHDQIKRIAQGTKVFSISNKNFSECFVGIPSKAEQSKIARLFSLLDKRIAVQSKLIEQLESLMGGIMVAHYNKCEKQVVQIKELGDYFTVKSLSKDDLTDKGYACVLYGELFTTYHCIICEVKSKTNLTSGLTLSQSNDLLFPSSTTVDAVSLIAPSAITIPDVVLGGDMFGLHINGRHSNVYLAFLFNYILKQRLAKYAQGSTIIHLHYKDIRNAKIEVPNLTDQLIFVELSSKVQQKINTENSMLANLQALKSYLLQQMFI